MLSKRTKTIGITAITVLLGGVTLLVGTLYFISAKEKELQAFVHTYATEKAEAAELRSLINLVDETRNERAELVTYFLTDNTVVDFLSLIETVAAEQGVVFEASSLEQQNMGESDVFAQLVLTVDIGGSFTSVVTMLEIFESLPYQVVVERVELSRPERPEVAYWQGTYTIRITEYIGT